MTGIMRQQFNGARHLDRQVGIFKQEINRCEFASQESPGQIEAYLHGVYPACSNEATL